MLSNSSVLKPLLSLGLCLSFWSINDPSCECSLFAKEHVEEYSSTHRVKWIIFILDHFNDFLNQTAAHMMASVEFLKVNAFKFIRLKAPIATRSMLFILVC